MPVILSFSGGADSTYLLHVLLKENEDVLPIYFDHQLRDQNDLIHLTIPHIKRKIPVKSYAKKMGISYEASGRYWRYRMLKHYQKLKNIPTVLTAHHLDDHIETFYLNLHRGYQSSLGGIPERQPFGTGELVRPLLNITKKEIVEYLQKNNISYVEDETNASSAFKRNQWRNTLLPLIEESYPEYKKIIKRQLRIFQEENAYWEEQMKPYLVTQKKAWEMTWSIPEPFQNLPHIFQNRILVKLLKTVHDTLAFTHEHIDTLRNALAAGKAPALYTLPNGIMCDHLKQTLRFSWGHKNRDVLPEKIETSPFTLRLKNQNKKIIISHSEKSIICRYRKPGDKIYLKNIQEEKRLKTYMIDKKIPRSERNRLPLFFVGNKLVCVPGYYIHPDFIHKLEVKIC